MRVEHILSDGETISLLFYSPLFPTPYENFANANVIANVLSQRASRETRGRISFVKLPGHVYFLKRHDSGLLNKRFALSLSLTPTP